MATTLGTCRNRSSQMGPLWLVLGLVGLGLTMAGANAGAQRAAGHWSGVVAVGAAIPTGELSQHASTGAAGLLGLERWNHAGSQGLRFEGLGSVFAGGNYTKVCTQSNCGSRPSMWAGMANVMLGGPDSLSNRQGIGGYVFAGVGAGHTNALSGGATPGGSIGYNTLSTSGFAWDIGFGLRVPAGADRLLIEARYLNMAGPTTRTGVWPIMVGIQF